MRILKVENCSGCPFFVRGDVSLHVSRLHSIERMSMSYCDRSGRFLNQDDEDARYNEGMPDWCPLDPANLTP